MPFATKFTIENKKLFNALNYNSAITNDLKNLSKKNELLDINKLSAKSIADIERYKSNLGIGQSEILDKLEIILKNISPRIVIGMGEAHLKRTSVQTVNEFDFEERFIIFKHDLQKHVDNTPSEYDSILFKFGADEKAKKYKLNLYLGYCDSNSKIIDSNFTPIGNSSALSKNLGKPDYDQFEIYKERIIELGKLNNSSFRNEKSGIIHKKEDFKEFFDLFKPSDNHVYIFTSTNTTFNFTTLILSTESRLSVDEKLMANYVYFNRGGSCCPPTY